MQKKKIFRWLSTKRKGNITNISTALPMDSTEKGSFSLYSEIDTLPLSVFKQCVVKENLSALIISGYPSEEDLKLQWAILRDEYAAAIGDHEYIMYNNLFVAIEELQSEITCIETLISTMRDFFCIQYADLLNKMLMQNIVFDYTNRLQYQKQLTRCDKMKKFLETKKELKEQEFQAISDKHSGEGSGKITNAYFTSYLIAISKQVGYHVSDQITVGEYCEYVKGFNEYVEQIKNQQHAGK